MAGREPGRDLDSYIDYRHMVPEFKLQSATMVPPPKENLLRCVHKYASTNFNARFAVLRIWSAPHFWPLMVGLDNRDGTCFCNTKGRVWQWNFVPKDKPFSNCSMHLASTNRLRPYKAKLDRNVFLMRDIWVVMGKDEEELRLMASAATFAIQTEPWRLEVDWWKSFINIDLDFISKMNEIGWLDC